MGIESEWVFGFKLDSLYRFGPYAILKLKQRAGTPPAFSAEVGVWQLVR